MRNILLTSACFLLIVDAAPAADVDVVYPPPPHSKNPQNGNDVNTATALPRY